MQSAPIGVTIGKFNPPHVGHAHLLRVAAERTGHLFVILCDRSGQTIPAAARAAWLQDAAPENTTVLITPDDLPPENELWARRALEILPAHPALAFTSEPWGLGWAEAMGASHISVDVDRLQFPISARRIRQDLRGLFRWLVPAARAALARRVVIAGAESTGKTTIARLLAEEIGTTWAPEYGRTYWEGRRFMTDQSWTGGEFLRIARAQQRLLDDLSRRAERGVTLADTDALVTSVWRRRYLGAEDPELTALAAAHLPSAYLIAGLDVPWVGDGTRASERERDKMHGWTVECCRQSGVETHLLVGDLQARCHQALAVVDRLTSFEPLQ